MSVRAGDEQACTGDGRVAWGQASVCIGVCVQVWAGGCACAHVDLRGGARTQVGRCGCRWVCVGAYGHADGCVGVAVLVWVRAHRRVGAHAHR